MNRKPTRTRESRARPGFTIAELIGGMVIGGLVATGASDCHGTRYDPVRLGTVTTDPLQFAALKDRAGRSTLT